MLTRRNVLALLPASLITLPAGALSKKETLREWILTNAHHEVIPAKGWHYSPVYAKYIYSSGHGRYTLFMKSPVQPYGEVRKKYIWHVGELTPEKFMEVWATWDQLNRNGVWVTSKSGSYSVDPVTTELTPFKAPCSDKEVMENTKRWNDDYMRRYLKGQA